MAKFNANTPPRRFLVAVEDEGGDEDGDDGRFALGWTIIYCIRVTSPSPSLHLYLSPLISSLERLAFLLEILPSCETLQKFFKSSKPYDTTSESESDSSILQVGFDYEL
jgi:hypothetical protein